MTNDEPLTKPAEQELLDVAHHAVLEARDLLRARRLEAAAVRVSTPRDLKIAGEELAERRILERLAPTGIPILSEESGWVNRRRGSCDRRWIVDPLDGSVNFAKGIPMSCVSVALWSRRQPILGIIADINRDDLFWGVSGTGAFLNGAPLAPSTTETTGDSVLCTGFPAAGMFEGRASGGFVRAVARFRKVRLLGSAALSLAYVAAGYVDAYYEDRIRLWDVAAGLAIVSAAGGRFEYTAQEDETVATVLAWNGAMVDIADVWQG